MQNADVLPVENGGEMDLDEQREVVKNIGGALVVLRRLTRQYKRGGLQEEYKQAQRAIEDLERLAKHAELQLRQVRALQDELQTLQELSQDGLDSLDARSIVCPNCGERVRGFVDCYVFTCPFCGRAFSKVDLLQMELGV